MKNILVTIAGLTPAIITETLYAIARDEIDWPSEVHVITTVKGHKKIVDTIIANNVINIMSQELNQVSPELHIHIITDSNNYQIIDAISDEDNEIIANYIMQKMIEFTSNESIRIHASLAGGRKTMTFYMGYAMSLFGRQGDKLSHVLVNSDFENISNFYYPTQKFGKITHITKGELDPFDAEIILATIPIINIRSHAPKILQRFQHEIVTQGTLNQNILPTEEASINQDEYPANAMRPTFRFLIELFNLAQYMEDYELHVATDHVNITPVNHHHQHVFKVDFKSNLFVFGIYRLILRSNLTQIESERIYLLKNLKNENHFLYLNLITELEVMLGCPNVTNLGDITPMNLKKAIENKFINNEPILNQHTDARNQFKQASEWLLDQYENYKKNQYLPLDHDKVEFNNYYYLTQRITEINKILKEYLPTDAHNKLRPDLANSNFYQIGVDASQIKFI